MTSALIFLFYFAAISGVLSAVALIAEVLDGKARRRARDTERREQIEAWRREWAA